MSVQTMALVIDHSRASGSELITLMMIANHCGRDHKNAWPSYVKLAKDCRLDVRTVKRCVRNLELLGELIVERGAGPHGTNLYRVTIAGGDILPPPHPGEDENLSESTQTDSDSVSEALENLCTGGDRMPPPSVDNSENLPPTGSDTAPPGVAYCHGGGDTGVTGGVTRVSPKPSFNRPKDQIERAVDKTSVDNSEPILRQGEDPLLALGVMTQLLIAAGCESRWMTTPKAREAMKDMLEWGVTRDEVQEAVRRSIATTSKNGETFTVWYVRKVVQRLIAERDLPPGVSAIGGDHATRKRSGNSGAAVLGDWLEEGE